MSNKDQMWTQIRCLLPYACWLFAVSRSVCGGSREPVPTPSAQIRFVIYLLFAAVYLIKTLFFVAAVNQKLEMWWPEGTNCKFQLHRNIDVLKDHAAFLLTCPKASNRWIWVVGRCWHHCGGASLVNPPIKHMERWRISLFKHFDQEVCPGDPGETFLCWKYSCYMGLK